MTSGNPASGFARTPIDAPRMLPRAAIALGVSMFLASCAGTGLESLTSPGPEAPKPVTSGDVIGAGSVKIALLLPLSAANAQVPAQSLRNAAELAVQDFSGGNVASQNIQIIVKDDKGTPEGAAQAAQEAIASGAELILGPLFASSVRSVGQVARQAGKPVIAFSSDAGAAQKGVFLLSFLPQTDVRRVVDYAGSRGKRSIAALIPETAYGNVVHAELMNVGNQGGRRVASVERYAPGNKGSLDGAVARLKAGIGGADTLFIGEGADGLAPVLQALAAAGISSRSVQFISTGIWNDQRLFAMPQLEGAWFAAPDNTRFAQLSGRYQQRYGAAPTRIATLSYDAVTLASALTQNFGSQRFAEATLTNPNGFAGQDGVFRFRQTGLNDRGIAVFEVRGGSARAISAPPTSFAGN